jgi:hypothetical protein
MAIHLGQASLPGSSNLPESRTERAAPPLLFGLAPHGVYPAGTDYSGRGALLPHLFTLTRIQTRMPGSRRYIFCGTFRKTRFERAPPAVSRHAALWRPDFPPERRVETRLRAATRLTGPHLLYPLQLFGTGSRAERIPKLVAILLARRCRFRVIRLRLRRAR